MSLSENPMFGAIIGQQINNNRVADQIQDQNVGLKKSLNETNEVAVAASAQAASAVIQLLALRKEVEELDASDAGFSLSIAGIRGVTRELLTELRKSDPTNPLLDKKVRDRLFLAAKNEQQARQEGKDWKQRGAEYSQHVEAVFGAPNSGKGGPEKAQITSNAAVRQAAEVPSHVTEREQFLGLIGKLRDEVERLNPNSPILSDLKI
jgi:hypothetical protein